MCGEQMFRPPETPLTSPLYPPVKNEPLTYNTSIGNQTQKKRIGMGSVPGGVASAEEKGLGGVGWRVYCYG